MASLSGGERCRAALARLAGNQSNFLVLDEPTNHLDLWARDALERAITEFDGTVLLVSHDRYFVNRVADHLLLIEPDRIRVIEGNYDTYQQLLASGGGDVSFSDSSPPRKSPRLQSGGVREKQSSSGRARKSFSRAPKGSAGQTPVPESKGKHSFSRVPKGSDDRPPAKSAKKRRFAFRKLREIEDEIVQRETRIEEIHRELAQPAVVRDGQRVRQLKAEVEQEQAALKTLYEHWDEAAELNW